MPANDNSIEKATLADNEDRTSEEPISDDGLTDAQKNSIAMLNHLAVLSQDIHASRDNRMFLEEAYMALLNNTNPEAVSAGSIDCLTSMLDVIENYRMVSEKRERLQSIYDQDHAKTIQAAMPNTSNLLKALGSADIKRIAVAVMYIPIDSFIGYQNYSTDIERAYLQEGWALDDKESETLHENRKSLFKYMLTAVSEENLPSELVLSEKEVTTFVDWTKKENNQNKLLFLEKNEPTYHMLGNYWLELATCYYDLGNYEKCLNAITRYEELQIEIFKTDNYYAQALPMAIAAAHEVYEEAEYVALAERYLEQILNNADSANWALRYFAAEMYLDLSIRTGSQTYLNHAYETTFATVSSLVDVQRNMNKTYLATVKEVEEPDVPKNAGKEEKETIKAKASLIEEYNKANKEQRKVALPPVFQPLILNCDLLFAIVEERGNLPLDKEAVDGILHGNGNKLFLSAALENHYSFSPVNLSFTGSFEKKALVLPAACLNENASIFVSVNTNGVTTTYEDWTVKEVERASDDFDSFMVTFTSDMIKNQQWGKDSSVSIDIFSNEASTEPVAELKFEASKYKGLWVMPDAITFQQTQ